MDTQFLARPLDTFLARLLQSLLQIYELFAAASPCPYPTPPPLVTVAVLSLLPNILATVLLMLFPLFRAFLVWAVTAGGPLPAGAGTAAAAFAAATRLRAVTAAAITPPLASALGPDDGADAWLPSAASPPLAEGRCYTPRR